MKKFQMPSSYAALTAEEQRDVCGGGEFQDSVGTFFNNLHFDDFFYGGGLISFSITFVPMLLFRMVSLGVKAGITLYNEVTGILDRVLRGSTSAIQELDKYRVSSQAAQQTNSAYAFQALLK